MFMLYAIVLGLMLGLALGGRLGRLADLRLDWAWAAIAGLVAQVILFSEPVSAVVGDLGPPLYVASTALVLVVVIRNVPRIPGLALVALGAACNLSAILANGGYMPATPDALAAAERAATVGYSNSVQLARPALEPLVDRFALPPSLLPANVFSVGDILIGVGIVVVIVAAMRRGDAARAGTDDVETAMPDGGPRTAGVATALPSSGEPGTR